MGKKPAGNLGGSFGQRHLLRLCGSERHHANERGGDTVLIVGDHGAFWTGDATPAGTMMLLLPDGHNSSLCGLQSPLSQNKGYVELLFFPADRERHLTSDLRCQQPSESKQIVVVRILLVDSHNDVLGCNSEL
jgi:hypothetical protein